MLTQQWRIFQALVAAIVLSPADQLQAGNDDQNDEVCCRNLFMENYRTGKQRSMPELFVTNSSRCFADVAKVRETCKIRLMPLELRRKEFQNK